MKFKKSLAALLLVVPLVPAGCGSKDVDPHNNIDAPGYYNGPVKPRGAPKNNGIGETGAPQSGSGG